jgi:hypothetical protein
LHQAFRGARERAFVAQGDEKVQMAQIQVQHASPYIEESELSNRIYRFDRSCISAYRRGVGAPRPPRAT